MGHSNQASGSLNKEFGFNWNIEALLVIWFMHQLSLRPKQLSFRSSKIKINLCKDFLFRKIPKRFEEQESVLADYQLRIQSLEAQKKKEG
jgi:hypothetical protein